MVWKAISTFCVATVLAQLLICIVLFVRGSLTSDGITKIIAMMNGIDVSGDRIALKIKEAKESPVPSFDEVKIVRAKLGLEMDLRRRAQENYDTHLQVLQQRLKLDESRFDSRKDAFYRKVEEHNKGVKDEARKSLQKTIEALPAAMSKDQLIRMMDDGEGDLNDVVAIVKAMQADKRKKVLREFTNPDEAAKLQKILSRIGNGDLDNTQF